MDASAKKHLIERLEESRNRLFATFNGFSAEQWRFRPAGDCWSTAEIVEHVLFVEGRIGRGVAKFAATAPTPEKTSTMKDENIVSLAGNRSMKLQAPEPVRPAGAFASTDEMLAAFDQTRARSVELIEGMEADPRCHFFPHPIFGEMDCYQWLLLLSYHSDRHAAQIEELKADPAFPVAVGVG